MRVNKKSNKDVYSSYKPYQRLFNASMNKWDLYDEFNFRNENGYKSDASDSEYDYQSYSKNSVSQPMSTPPLATSMDVDDEDSSAALTHS